MGRPLDADLIKRFAAEFAKFPILKTRGFSMLVNMSGKLFTAKCPSRKDVDANLEVGYEIYTIVQTHGSD